MGSNRAFNCLRDSDADFDVDALVADVGREISGHGTRGCIVFATPPLIRH